MSTTSLEYVDERGRKVRVNVESHWADLRDSTVALTMVALGQSLGLSDFEDGEDEGVTRSLSE